MHVFSGVTIGTLNHDYKIDWLELNPIANYLLFRNEIQQLHLFNVITKVFHPLYLHTICTSSAQLYVSQYMYLKPTPISEMKKISVEINHSHFTTTKGVPVH
jgi:hypothetical protein